MEEMQQLEPGDDTKQKMLDILKRFHSEEEAESMDDDDDGKLLIGAISYISLQTLKRSYIPMQN